MLETIYATICSDSQNLSLTMGKKIFFAQAKYRVRWKNNAVFSLEKTVLDRIPLYKRTVLKEECLYFNVITYVIQIGQFRLKSKSHVCPLGNCEEQKAKNFK